MKTRTLILLTIICSFTWLLAQPTPPPVEERIQQLVEALELTPAQAEQVQTILQNERQEAESVRAANRGNTAALRAAAKDRRSVTNGQIKNVLTAEQWEKYQKMAPGSDDSGEITDRYVLRLKQQLNLNADQTDRVAEIWEEAREEMDELRGYRSGDRRENMQKMREIRQAADSKIEDILTTEQKTEFQKIKQEQQNEMRSRMDGRRRGRR